MDREYKDNPNYPSRDQSKIPTPTAIAISLKFWNQLWKDEHGEYRTKASSVSIYKGLLSRMRIKHTGMAWAKRDDEEMESHFSNEMANGKRLRYYAPAWKDETVSIILRYLPTSCSSFLQAV